MIFLTIIKPKALLGLHRKAPGLKWEGGGGTGINLPPTDRTLDETMPEGMRVYIIIDSWSKG